MDSFSFLIGLVMGLVLLPTLIGVLVICKKFDVKVSIEPLKRLLSKVKNRD